MILHSNVKKITLGLLQEHFFDNLFVYQKEMVKSFTINKKYFIITKPFLFNDIF